MSRPSTFVALCCLLVLPVSTRAAVVVVPAGTGTLQAAIDAAAPGTTLLLDGVYVGPVVIDKALRITCTTNCGIDAACQADVAVDIVADGVLLRSERPAKQNIVEYRQIDVYRGRTTQIRIANRQKVELRARVNAVALQFNSCGTEQYGIEVSGTSSKIKLVDAGGYTSPAGGLLLSGLAPKAKVQIRNYRAIDNGVAIAVVNSAVGSRLGKSGIAIDRPLLIDNAIGLQVVGSDGLRMKHALVISNEQRVGDVGITLDASSNRNLISASAWDDRSGTGTAYIDAGTGNCGSGNVGFPNTSCH